MLSPADIDSKQFGTTRLKEGYDQDEVDAFLDRLQEDYSFLQQTVQRLEEDNRTLRRVADSTPTQALERPERPSAVAEKLLEVAAEAARQIEAEAQAKADGLIREAGSKGARMVEDAASAVEKMKSEGLAERYRRNEELDKEFGETQRKYTALVADGSQVRRALTAAIAAYDKELTP
jgi:DivIVA domain-containing protein